MKIYYYLAPVLVISIALTIWFFSSKELSDAYVLQALEDRSDKIEYLIKHYEIQFELNKLCLETTNANVRINCLKK
jgi:hypothetical protein